MSTLPRSDCEFGGQNKTEFEVCLSFCDLVEGEWAIYNSGSFGKNGQVHLIPKTNCPSDFSSKQWKNNKFLVKLSTKRGKCVL